MSCNSCQSKFSFFTKENACPRCGFSYCSKCLKFKLVSDAKKICGPCYNKLSNESSSSSSRDDDELHKPILPVDIEKKLNSLDNPTKPPITIYQQGRLDKLKTGLDPQDQAIVDRLKKLKDEDKKPSLPTTEEIQRRLALLKDQDPDYTPKPINIHQVDTRSYQQKVSDLIEEYLSTLQLSNKDPTEDIEKRLNILKGINPPQSSSIEIDDDDDDETVTKNILKKALAEAELEKKYENNDEELEMEIEAGRNDLDFEDYECCMCERRKNLVKCTGCNDDLFCPPCFEDNHDDFEAEKHRSIPLKLSR